MRYIYLFALMLCVYAARSQANASKRLYIIPQAGLLNGDKYVSAQALISIGIEHKGWGFGMGSGIDYYKIRTVPVFIDIRKNIGVQHWPLFAYMQAGWNIAAPLVTQIRSNSWLWPRSDSEFDHGWYGEMGIGYSFLDKQKKGFQLSLGFTAKTVRERYTEFVYRDFPPYTSTEEIRRLYYTFNRAILKLGYRL